jgi:HlyD family secretion protein
MKKKRILIGAAVAAVLAYGLYAFLGRSRSIVLTGVVTTDEVVVSSEIQGRVQQLRVREGDVVKRGQVLAVIQPAEWRADVAYYAGTQAQAAALVSQDRADLRFQEAQTGNGILQAEANLASAQAQVAQAQADQENARLNYRRENTLFAQGTDSAQAHDQARTAYDGANARVVSLQKQVAAARAALAQARADADQTAARRAALEAAQGQLAAAAAQADKARVYLGYTEIKAPIDGVVDVRAALQGEVVTPGEAIVTLINPDNLWVRTDVEESYIDRIRLGERLRVRLPSGAVREGTVFFRGVDADYATQRDVSRTKRDIKTFEIRLRCDNRDRSLAVGMTAYVILPL